MTLRKCIAVSAVLIVVALGAAALAAALAWRTLDEPLALPAGGEWLEVRSGMSLRRISDELAARGLLEHPKIVAWYGGYTGAATRIHAGEYRLAAGTTPRTLLDQLTAGAVHLHELTVIEGWRFAEFLRALRSHPAIVPSELSPAEIMAALGEPDMHPEGLFYPDTYRFAKGTPELDVLRAARRAMQQRLDREWAARSPDIQIDTPYEALILASIIEKETALASERPLIAGVFHERLRRNMRLETDPTVIYGLGDDFDGDLRRADMRRDTPYNTYTRAGLPPTPIALPGGDSIAAALNPAETNAVFFVATGLPDGSHTFSATLAEHERAVELYLQRLRGTAQ